MNKIILILFLFSISAFAVTEITKISFKQTSVFDKDDLLDIINSEEDEEFDPRLLKLDRIVLSNFLQKNGYLLATVNDSLYFSRDREKVHLRFVIDVGPRYYYGGVHFKGVVQGDTTKLKEAFSTIKIDTPFDESKVNAAVKKVEKIYYNTGKPYVVIKTDYHFVEDSLAFAQLMIKENETVYIKDIKYFGLKMVKKFLIRRELEITDGDMYSLSAMQLTQQNIYGTGLFRFVSLEIEPIENEPQNVILRITVQEKDTRWFGVTFGVGYEQDVGSSTEITLQGGHRNLFGTARSASLHFTPSFLYDFEKNEIINSENEIAFKFIEPWIGNTRTPGILQLSYHQFRLPNSGDFNQFQTSFEVHHNFRNDIETNGTLSAKFIQRIDDDQVDSLLFVNFDQNLRKSEIYTISSYTKRDTRPNLFNPMSGSLTDFSVSFSHSISDKTNKQTKEITQEVNQYFTIVSSWARYQPWRIKIGKTKMRWTLASRIKIGGIFELGKTKYIPVSERFYAGGATTVRGYDEQTLGPAESLYEDGYIKNSAGGKLLFLTNVEARIPLFWLFLAEFFVDAGNVWPDLSDFTTSSIRYTTGAGIAVLTPLGPIRVDYGYKLNKRKIDGAPDAFHLGIYFAF